MSQAIDDLKHEHEAILFALKILESINKKITTGASVEQADLAEFVGFLKEFADKCHHGKEEGVLFPALAKAGAPEQDEAVNALLHEHVEGRDWIHKMESSIYPNLRATEFVEASRHYTDLLKAHIAKENDILFPMAEQSLTPAQLDTLFQDFEEHETRVMGPGRHEQLHELLKTLKNKYQPSR